MAGPPEKPEVAVEGVTARTASFVGVLNPKAKGESGTYQFVYRSSTKNECRGAGETRVPAVPASAAGAPGEAVFEAVTGLVPGTEYAVCLVAENGKKEATSSVPLSFTTVSLLALEAPEVAVGRVAAEEATFRGVLNPFAGEASEEGTYRFLYNKGAKCEGGSATTPGVAFGESHEELPVELAVGLAANSEYTVCLSETNVADTRTVISPQVHFTTAPEAPVTKEPAADITATSAVLEGTLNPNTSAKAGWFFVISSPGGSSCNEHGVNSTEPEAQGKLISVEPTEVAGLEPLSQYRFCLVATHKVSQTTTETFGNEVSFETPAAPPVIVSESSSAVRSFSATLEAHINPNNQETTYAVEYATNEAFVGATRPPGATGTFPAGFSKRGEKVSVGTGAVLAAGTTYFYRVVARNAGGEESREVGSFTTPPVPVTGPVSVISASTATFDGDVTLGAADTTYSFDYEAGSASECTAGQSTAGEDTGAGPGVKTLSSEVTGLKPGTQYAVCLVVSTGSGSEVGPVVTFTTPLTGPPALVSGSESASEVTADSARLGGEIIPNGGETTYWFEYGTTNGYGRSTPPGRLGFSDDGPHPASMEAQGLSPLTTYHYRVVAVNLGRGPPVYGPDRTFMTQGAGSIVLPDDRQWEMVTPASKHGALFKGFGEEREIREENDIRASAAGDAIADVARSPSEAQPGANPNLTTVLSTRGGSGWSSQVISPPHPVPGPVVVDLQDEEYLFFSDDLSRAIVQPISDGFPRLSPDASESTPYVRTDYFNENVGERCEGDYRTVASCFEPLVDEANDTADPFQPFGELTPSGECRLSRGCGPLFLAASPDLGHVVVSSRVQLTQTPVEAEPEESPNFSNLYEFSGGRLALLSVLPGRLKGSRRLILAGSGLGGPGAFHGNSMAVRRAISDDGERVVLEAFAPVGAGGHPRIGLYLRENAMAPESPLGGRGECVVSGDACTVRLDVPVVGCVGCTGSVEPQYMDASSDGSRIFFLDSARLTSDAGAVPGREPSEDRADLYEYDLRAPEGRRLVDLTARMGGESARVAAVLGVSEDGSYVYFAAAGGLGLAQSGGCERHGSEPGEHVVVGGAMCNVFVRHEGVTCLVARLSQQDGGDWQNDNGLSNQSVRVSPDGRWLAFVSSVGLTGYDDRDVGTGQADGEVYVFRASEGAGCGGVGVLACASCDSTGARPLGGAGVPGWTEVEDHVAFYQPRYLSDSGRVFFNSSDALVPDDVSGQSEVYEYEPEGVGLSAPCSPAAASGSVVFKAQRLYVAQGREGREGAGCVGLISSGESPEGSAFLEASESGGDVFFLTRDKLVPQDTEGSPSVYDAHECSSVSPCVAASAEQPPACATEATCKAPATPGPSVYGAPSSATFSGPGNVALLAPPAVVKPKAKPVKCKRGLVRRKIKKKELCVRVKSKKQAKKASHDRRAR